MTRFTIVILSILYINTLNAQTLVSQFDFYSTNLGYATIGAHATGWNTTNARFYSTGGQGVYFSGNGSNVGLDLKIPRAAFDTLGSITLAFDYYRRESEATFFEMDYFKFHMSGAKAIVVYRVVGDVANRTFTTNISIPASRSTILLKYDSKTGDLELYINDILQATQSTGTTKKLLWPSSTAEAKVGVQMDGAGSSLPSLYQFQIFSGATLKETLPVQLVSFFGVAKSDGNYLTWETASELNNSRFEIEKSNDGHNFITIGRVEGAGNSNVIQKYFFKTPLESQRYYYRLKQIDFDGQFEYSEMISIAHAHEANVSLYPVPSEVNSTINLICQENGMAMIYNSIGQMVLQVKLVEKQLSSFEIVQNGYYNVVIYSDNGDVIETKKLVVK